MSINQKMLLRNRMLGVMIRDSRQVAKKTPKDCAEFLGIMVDDFTDIELGRRPISLPELEAFSYLVDTPLEHFWDSNLLSKNGKKEPPPAEMFILRNRIVGALIRQARLDAEISIETCAQAIDISTETLAAYELGQMSVPLSELEILTETLEIDLGLLVDSEHNPMTRKTPPTPTEESFSHLSEDLLAFLREPLNTDYVRTAHNLSMLPADRLRRIAETLLEITY